MVEGIKEEWITCTVCLSVGFLFRITDITEKKNWQLAASALKMNAENMFKTNHFKQKQENILRPSSADRVKTNTSVCTFTLHKIKRNK